MLEDIADQVEVDPSGAADRVELLTTICTALCDGEPDDTIARGDATAEPEGGDEF